jgi:IclR family acetate operon transcriptional repressor
MTKKKSLTIDSLTRGIDLLELLAEHDSLKLAELPELLGTSRATAFRLLKTLQGRGYVEHVPSLSAYRLGPAALLLASRSQAFSLVRIAEPALRDLAEKTGETVNLAIFRGGHLIYVEIVEGRHALRMSGSIGQTVPMHSTALGNAILAALPPDHQRALLGNEPWEQYTPRTPRTWKALEPELASAAKRGYALDLQQMDEGAVCVGAAVIGSNGHPIGGISVSGWVQRIDEAKQREIGETLSSWCAAISQELGFLASPGEGVSAVA